MQSLLLFSLYYWLAKIHAAFTIYSFASFCKVSQGFANGLSQGFSSAKIVVFRVSLNRSPALLAVRCQYRCCRPGLRAGAAATLL